ncbi:hypothetical protein MSMEI_1747 [Mycolicibacterium smegmatis MC2 155]|uniref:Uncharacterized protein n=1 Tax=Mycolicibacterium smegmatis (strain ATCC 700084 / mc(2)155) TaxID=246196 RepID=I7G6F6_MYCS2|nr:hypothetical protein MSMEI_1747 [Mycolicibacterium smegmatis MC2 155]
MFVCPSEGQSQNDEVDRQQRQPDDRHQDAAPGACGEHRQRDHHDRDHRSAVEQHSEPELAGTLIRARVVGAPGHAHDRAHAVQEHRHGGRNRQQSQHPRRRNPCLAAGLGLLDLRLARVRGHIWRVPSFAARCTGIRSP